MGRATAKGHSQAWATAKHGLGQAVQAHCPADQLLSTSSLLQTHASQHLAMPPR